MIQVAGLRKVYGDLVAVDGISFAVQPGEIFGMVGPNGAGKTTTIECLEGLRRPDAGSVSVLGLDPWGDGYAVRARVGIQLQEAALPHRIKVWEALDLFASLYPRSTDVDALLAQLGLTGKRTVPYAKLSGGQKRRLSIALALVGEPEVVFLDELTTGLDLHARRAMWDRVRAIRASGTTVFLTTHFMEEAERLCDRVAIVDQGRILALDAPGNVVRSLGAETRLAFTAPDGRAPDLLTRLPGVSRVEASGGHVVVVGHGHALAGDVVAALTAGGVPFTDLRTEQPTLDDAFLALTGRELRD